MSTTVLIVTSDYYAGESLAETVKAAFGDAVSVKTTYRVYSIPPLQAGDIVLSDGTCKDREDGGYSYPVRFDASRLAEKSGAVHVPFGRKQANLFARLLRQNTANHTVKTDAVIAKMRRHLS